MYHKQLLKKYSQYSFVKKTQHAIINTADNVDVKVLYGSAKSLFVASLIKNNPNIKFVLLAPNANVHNDYVDDLNVCVNTNIFSLKYTHNSSIIKHITTSYANLIDNLGRFATSTGLAIAEPEVFKFWHNFENKTPLDYVATQSNDKSTLDNISNRKTSKLKDAEPILHLPTLENVQKHFCNLKQKQALNIYQFTTNLSLNGFQKEQYVSRPGEYSIRGGIVDVFAPNMSNPFRLELWGDLIDSIRFFDPLSQRSIQELTEIDFIDSLFVENDINISSDIYSFIEENTIFIIDTPEAYDFALNYLKPITNYRRININPLVVADSNKLIEVHCTPQPKMYSSIQRFAFSANKWLELDIDVHVSADGDVLSNRFKDLLESLNDADEKWLDLTSKNSADCEFEEPDIDLGIRNIFPQETSGINIDAEYLLNSVTWHNTTLSTGFCLLDEKLIYLVEHEIFSRTRNSKSNKINIAKGISLRELKQLNIGDFIVHEDKGIGKFAGFQAIDMGGSKQDCLKMLFSDNDVLYVHLNYLHKVQKYSASEGVVPRLSKLGSTEWLRKKNRTKSKLKDIARDLILLYAARRMQKGFSFPSDTTWQKEFEASFIYEDTIDQARTTEEVKKDMEMDIPMDRLVCGDVGFGKTEIAIRAAFKAALAGKQTAVLVPTTILAEQHFYSFRERMGRYPVTVDTLSRFRNKQQQKDIIDRLKENKIDIIIGTHRILSKDIEFKNLGLLIIDEEHRFGVGAKEKLRQLKSNVDTLTLTATPIPRTLNFSLMGARDLSQMETPPRNRLPVETEINEFSIENVSKYILDEIKRQGQVFIVNDKIGGLEELQSELQEELPGVRFALIHGQMQPAKIEDVMEKFIEKKYDVLLATKIIESGIDIPNANTIVINNANHFGLAELYQLRGRVGRSNIQAYCYLLVPNFQTLPTKALRRLLAIEEFTDLGSGLQLALRDLEIRGSGDLLGAQQSGFISEIGFELYQKVLEEAVSELKTEEFSDVFNNKGIQNVGENGEILPKFNNEDINIETENDAFFPVDYIPDDTERFHYYKLLFEVATNKQLNDIAKELEDRYGKLPKEALELIFVVRLRIATLNTGFTRICLKTNELHVEFPKSDNKIYYEKVFPIILDTIKIYDDIELLQEKEKLLLRKNFDTQPDITKELLISSDAIDFLWKIKKTIEASF